MSCELMQGPHVTIWEFGTLLEGAYRSVFTVNTVIGKMEICSLSWRQGPLIDILRHSADAHGTHKKVDSCNKKWGQPLKITVFLHKMVQIEFM